MSARYWDHNDTFEQFLGSHAFVSCGLMNLLSRICPADVKFNSPVSSVEKKDGILNIKCNNGEIYSADKVKKILYELHRQ